MWFWRVHRRRSTPRVPDRSWRIGTAGDPATSQILTDPAHIGTYALPALGHTDDRKRLEDGRGYSVLAGSSVPKRSAARASFSSS